MEANNAKHYHFLTSTLSFVSATFKKFSSLSGHTSAKANYLIYCKEMKIDL